MNAYIIFAWHKSIEFVSTVDDIYFFIGLLGVIIGVIVCVIGIEFKSPEEIRRELGIAEYAEKLTENMDPKIIKLQELFNSGVITKSEFDTQKKRILLAKI